MDPETEALVKNNPQLGNILRKIEDDLSKVINKEEDLSNILLKGHLCIENILEELLAVFDLNGSNPLNTESFSSKVSRVQKMAEKKQDKFMQKLVSKLRAINDVRNNLAHDIKFTITEADISKIGVNVGSVYIVNKYKIGHSNLKENLLFCLQNTITDIGVVIFNQIRQIEYDENAKNLAEEK